jgi:hypothetical protein
MAVLGEELNVLPKGFTRLLLATLQVPSVTESHKGALKVAREVLLEIPQLSITFLGRWSSQALAASA